LKVEEAKLDDLPKAEKAKKIAEKKAKAPAKLTPAEQDAADEAKHEARLEAKQIQETQPPLRSQSMLLRPMPPSRDSSNHPSPRLSKAPKRSKSRKN